MTDLSSAIAQIAALSGSTREQKTPIEAGRVPTVLPAEEPCTCESDTESQYESPRCPTPEEAKPNYKKRRGALRPGKAVGEAVSKKTAQAVEEVLLAVSAVKANKAGMYPRLSQEQVERLREEFVLLWGTPQLSTFKAIAAQARSEIKALIAAQMQVAGSLVELAEVTLKRAIFNMQSCYPAVSWVLALTSREYSTGNTLVGLWRQYEDMDSKNRAVVERYTSLVLAELDIVWASRKPNHQWAVWAFKVYPLALETGLIKAPSLWATAHASLLSKLPRPQGSAVGKCLAESAWDGLVDKVREPVNEVRAVRVAQAIREVALAATDVPETLDQPGESTDVEEEGSDDSAWRKFVRKVDELWRAFLDQFGCLLSSVVDGLTKAWNKVKELAQGLAGQHKQVLKAALSLVAIAGMVAGGYLIWDKHWGDRKYTAALLAPHIQPQGAVEVLSAVARKAGAVALLLGATAGALHFLLDLGEAAKVLSSSLTLFSALQTVGAASKLSRRRDGNGVCLVRHPGSQEEHPFQVEGCCKEHVDQLTTLDEVPDSGWLSELMQLLKDNWVWLVGGCTLMAGLYTAWRKDYFRRFRHKECNGPECASKKKPQPQKHARGKKYRVYVESGGVREMTASEFREYFHDHYDAVDRVQLVGEEDKVLDFWEAQGPPDHDTFDLYEQMFNDDDVNPKLEERKEEEQRQFDEEVDKAVEERIGRMHRSEGGLRGQGKKKGAQDATERKADPAKACKDVKCPLFDLPDKQARKKAIDLVMKTNKDQGKKLKFHLASIFHWNKGTTEEAKAKLIAGPLRPQSLQPSTVPRVRCFAGDQYVCTATAASGKLWMPFHCLGADDASKVTKVEFAVGSEKHVHPMDKFKVFHKPGSDLAYLEFKGTLPWPTPRIATAPQQGQHVLTMLFNPESKDFEINASAVQNVDKAKGVIVISSVAEYRPIDGSCGGQYVQVDVKGPCAVHHASTGARHFGLLLPQGADMSQWVEYKWQPGESGVGDASRWKQQVVQSLQPFCGRS